MHSVHSETPLDQLFAPNLYRSCQNVDLIFDFNMDHKMVSLGALNVDKTVFFLCDVQEKFAPAILYFTELVDVSKKLVEVGKILSIPLVVTEQYPTGLGATVPELDVKHAACVVPKTKFSMFVPDVENALKTLCGGSVESVVLMGLEAHVCIEQTAMDLIHRGIKVHVVADATSSRTQENRLLAFQRLRQIGCFVSTAETVIFKLLGDKNHSKFNDIRGLVKLSSPDTGLGH